MFDNWHRGFYMFLMNLVLIVYYRYTNLVYLACFVNCFCDISAPWSPSATIWSSRIYYKLPRSFWVFPRPSNPLTNSSSFWSSIATTCHTQCHLMFTLFLIANPFLLVVCKVWHGSSEVGWKIKQSLHRGLNIKTGYWKATRHFSENPDGKSYTKIWILKARGVTGAREGELPLLPPLWDPDLRIGFSMWLLICIRSFWRGIRIFRSQDVIPSSRPSC